MILMYRRALDSTAATTVAGRRPGILARGLDGLMDFLLLAFAAWTILYHLALLLRPSTATMLGAWLVVSVAIAALLIRRAVALKSRPAVAGPPADAEAESAEAEPEGLESSGEATEAGDESAEEAAVPAGRPRALVLWLGPALALAAGIMASVGAGSGSTTPWWIAVVLGLLAVLVTAADLLLTREWSRPDRQSSLAGSLIVLLVAAGFATASLYIVNTDADDAYFVSRSVWVAQHGRIPFNDVIFTQGTVKPLIGEPPVSSVEVLFGGLARLFGLQGATFVYVVALPGLVFLAMWAIWRLIRDWAPRRALLCFGVAAVYLLWDGLSPATLGSFHLLRMWQGKGAFVSIVIPLLYLHLSRWAEKRSRPDLLLAGAAGVAATGLTSSAAFLVPLMVAAVMGPLLLTGQIKAGLAASAGLAYPVLAGLAVLVVGEKEAVPGTFNTVRVSYDWVLTHGVTGALAGCALWLTPWMVRRGGATLVTAGIAAVASVLFIPGVLELIDSATGAGIVLWRTMWVVPAPVLIGLLAAIPLPRYVRLLAPVPAAALATAMIVYGMPLWSGTLGSSTVPKPSWKADYPALREARDLVAANRGGGLILAPPWVMRYVPIKTSLMNAVDPNDYYLGVLPASPQFIQDRRRLTVITDSRKGEPPEVPELTTLLKRNNVTIACVGGLNTRGQKLLAKSGFGGPVVIHRLVCLFPTAG